MVKCMIYKNVIKKIIQCKNCFDVIELGDNESVYCSCSMCKVTQFNGNYGDFTDLSVIVHSADKAFVVGDIFQYTALPEDGPETGDWMVVLKVVSCLNKTNIHTGLCLGYKAMVLTGGYVGLIVTVAATQCKKLCDSNRKMFAAYLKWQQNGMLDINRLMDD